MLNADLVHHVASPYLIPLMRATVANLAVRLSPNQSQKADLYEEVILEAALPEDSQRSIGYTYAIRTLRKKDLKRRNQTPLTPGTEEEEQDIVARAKASGLWL